MRDETINWSQGEGFRENGDRFDMIFKTVYDDVEIAFGVPLTHNNIHPGHIGYVKLTLKPDGQSEAVHKILLDRNAIIDWQLGLAFIASKELRSPYSEIVVTESDDGADNTETV